MYKLYLRVSSSSSFDSNMRRFSFSSHSLSSSTSCSLQAITASPFRLVQTLAHHTLGQHRPQSSPFHHHFLAPHPEELQENHLRPGCWPYHPFRIWHGPMVTDTNIQLL